MRGHPYLGFELMVVLGMAACGGAPRGDIATTPPEVDSGAVDAATCAVRAAVGWGQLEVASDVAASGQEALARHLCLTLRDSPMHSPTLRAEASACVVTAEEAFLESAIARGELSYRALPRQYRTQLWRQDEDTPTYQTQRTGASCHLVFFHPEWAAPWSSVELALAPSVAAYLHALEVHVERLEAAGASAGDRVSSAALGIELLATHGQVDLLVPWVDLWVHGAEGTKGQRYFISAIEMAIAAASFGDLDDERLRLLAWMNQEASHDSRIGRATRVLP